MLNGPDVDVDVDVFGMYKLGIPLRVVCFWAYLAFGGRHGMFGTSEWGLIGPFLFCFWMFYIPWVEKV